MQQTNNLMIRGQVHYLQNQIKELSTTIEKLIDIVREISIKTDVSMELLDSDASAAPAPAPAPAPVMVQPSSVARSAAPTLSGNLRRR